MDIYLLIALIAFSFLYYFYQRWIYRDKDDKGPQLTGPATVKSHRVEQGNFRGKAPTRYQGNNPGRWNYIVTFTLSDGEELELYTFEDVYRALKDGTSGLLTWQGRSFLEFETYE